MIEVRPCPRCGGINPTTSSFCNYCGTALTAPLPSAPPGSAGPAYAQPQFVPPPVSYAPMFSVPNVAQQRTETGLLLMVIGFGLGWIPYVGAVGGLLILIGAVLLWLGRRAYPEPHPTYVLFAGILIVIAFLGAIVSSVLFISVLFAAAETAGGTLPQFGAAAQSDLTDYFVAVAVFGFLNWLAFVLLPFGLADRTSRALLGIGLVVGIVITSFVAYEVIPRIDQAIRQATSGSQINLGPITALQDQALVLGLLNIVPYLLFLLAYYRVLEDLRRKAGRSNAPYV